jgi:hypothetical protein
MPRLVRQPRTVSRGLSMKIWWLVVWTCLGGRGDTVGACTTSNSDALLYALLVVGSGMLLGEMLAHRP